MTTVAASRLTILERYRRKTRSKLLRIAGILLAVLISLVVVGFFTNMCVETTVRMAGNMGYDTYLIPDGCATTNRIGIDGVDYDPEVVHAMTVANLHGEFCTAIKPSEAIALLRADATNLNRVQGNE